MREAMFPAQIIGWSHGGIAPDQPFDEICPGRAFAKHLIAVWRNRSGPDHLPVCAQLLEHPKTPVCFRGHDTDAIHGLRFSCAFGCGIEWQNETPKRPEQMQTTACALTMVRDDAFFLKAWLRHYGEMLGRENCYVVNHGGGAEVAALAQGCNVIAIPGNPHRSFDMKRWRMLNNFVQGLRCYYTHVIVGDVDELVVVDPVDGRSLLEFLQTSPAKRVLTPVGLEIIHHIDIEDQPITDRIIGPRRYVRPATHYSKPCILSHGAKIARGGHFTQFEELITPDPLYLFHLKFCDFDTYVAVMNARNQVAQEVGVSVENAAIGRHWFAEARGEDRALFESFAGLQQVPGFRFDGLRKQMHASWKPRGEGGLWQFDRPDFRIQFHLPDRFVGLI